VIAFIGTVAGSYFGQRKSIALIAYRLEQLEQKVNQHNNLIDKTYQLETKIDLHEEKIRVANHRISDLEKTKA
jgi:rRNA processing protein Krr1/Pno1